MTLSNHNDRRRAAYNSGLAKVAVQCSLDTFVVNQSLVLRINICGKNRHLRQAANRYMLCCATSSEISLSQMLPTTSTKFKKSVFNSSWSKNGVAYP